MSRWCIALAIACAIARAQTPDNVLVVVNDASSASREIAAYYMAKRQVPQGNLCHIKTAPDEEVERSVFDTAIVRPVAKCLTSRNLTDKILYIVTTLGVPLKIAGPEEPNGTYASVDSELTLLYGDMKSGKPHPLNGPLTNPLFVSQYAPFRHPQIPIYLVTRLAAYDVKDVKAMIDRGLMAKNRGKFVLDLRGASKVNTGNDWLQNAALLLPKDRVIVDEGEAVIRNQKDVIAYASWGSNDSNRHDRDLGFTWLPGAIVTEFVSTNARTFVRPDARWVLGSWGDRNSWYAGSPQSLTADYIHQGASGASGHTSEPYLSMTPRPDFVLPAYNSGRNLAESFYIGIPALSWQNVVIGDPLCTLAKP